MRPPDFVIGSGGDANAPYLRRWYVIPRNPWFNIYLHEILRSDGDRALHDHPWWNVSILLRGRYVEHTLEGARERCQGAVIFRRAIAAHRLEISPGESCWTLFITGPRTRVWGFHCPQGWVDWRDFVDDRDTGRVGRGCGEA